MFILELSFGFGPYEKAQQQVWKGTPASITTFSYFKGWSGTHFEISSVF